MKGIAVAIVKFHIAKGVYCGAASVRALKLQTLNGGTIQYQCRYNGKYVEHAKVVTEDIIAKNGVVHIINKPLIPNIVKTVIELSRDLKLKTFVDMVHRGGFNQYLENRKGFTLFAPSDDAFKGLPTTYLQTLQSQPGLIDKMLKYHTVQNKAFSDSFIGGKILPTSMEGTHIKIHTYRTKMTINDAEIQSSDKECSNAVIHIINKVLIPPEHTLLDLLSLQGDLSDFKKAVEMVNVTDVLSDEQKQLTVIAPTNSAMRKVDKKIYDDKKLLKKFILRHVIEGVVVSAGLTPGITYTVPSIQSERVSFKLEPSNDVLWINKDSKAISKDRIAKNGYLFKLDQVLHCKCNKRK